MTEAASLLRQLREVHKAIRTMNKILLELISILERSETSKKRGRSRALCNGHVPIVEVHLDRKEETRSDNHHAGLPRSSGCGGGS